MQSSHIPLQSAGKGVPHGRRVSTLVASFWGATLTGCVTLLCLVGSSFGQGVGGKQIPTVRYYSAFTRFHDGDFDDALDVFVDERRGAIKKPGMLWLDSICYYTMMGESYYRMGQLDKALDSYTMALQLYIQYSDWMSVVQFQNPRLASNQKPCPWGTSSRGAKLGKFPTSMSIMQGEINVNKQIERGGVIQQRIAIPIHVSEILRCTCLAIRRRTELLGPLCPDDPITRDLVDVLSRRQAPPNHWAQAWIDVQLGLALIGAGKPNEAIPTLNRAIVVSGQYDHPLTPTVLVELGRLALNRGDYKTAISYLNEASIAAYFYDLQVVEESLRLGTVAHLASNGKGVYAPLPAAVAWCKTKGYRHIQASILLNAAECNLAGRQSREAVKSLADTKALSTRRAMSRGMIGARYHYLLATCQFQEGQLAEGYQELTLAMTFMQFASKWLFQLGRLDGHALAGNISINSPLTPRIAMDLYDGLLRDPSALDWALRPMESLAYLKTPHAHSYEHWFLIAVSRKDQDRALEISDLSRRHRFHSSMPFGGRLLSLRKILEAPEGELSRELQLERQNLLAEYATYEAMSQQGSEIRQQLKAIPLTTTDEELLAKQRKLFEQWQAVSDRQEALLREIAVRRDAASLTFPPVRSLKEIRESLPQRHAVLAFYKAKGEIYGFLLNKEAYGTWRLPAPAKVTKGLVTTLRDMGQYGGNREFTVEELADTKWRDTAQKFLKLLLEGSQADFCCGVSGTRHCSG